MILIWGLILSNIIRDTEISKVLSMINSLGAIFKSLNELVIA